MKMNYFKLLISIVVLSLIGACSSYDKSYEVSEDGVSIKQSDSLEINISVYDEDIIRVVKERVGGVDSEIPEYVVTLEPQGVEWSVKPRGGSLVISTSKLKVSVDNCGVVEFKSRRGKELLSESGDYILDGQAEYKVSQSFVAGDEALYGLGQYQSGIMDWRGVSVRMRQYNQEIVVPFLASTKGYGIYWNNYSVTDFNPAEHELYFDDKSIDLAVVNDSSAMNAEDVAASKSDGGHDRNNNRQQTTFTPAKSGKYSFFVVADKLGRRDSDIQLVISGDTIVDYSTTWTPQCFSGVKELEAGVEYDILFNNKGASIPGNVYYNEPDYNKSTFASAQGDRIDYFFMGSGDMAQAVALNTKLSGGTPMLDMKAYGFWQCRERYATQQELLENANQMRERRIPFDIIVQDWFYWPQGTKGPEWDRAKYPNPKEMTAELKDLNLQLLVSVWPTVTNPPLLKKYGIDEQSKLNGGDYLDFYDEDIRKKYYRMLSDSMLCLGVDGIWLDGSEPESSKMIGTNTSVGLFDKVANPYSLLVTRAMYEGHREEFPDKRVLNLTRSGFVGQQRYGAVIWSGDVKGTWNQFSEQIAAGLNTTVAGLNYWTHDIGGFFRDSKSINRVYDSQYTNPEYIELLTRWFQFGSLSPIFRIHGYKSQTEIWRYNRDFEATARKFIDLRYQLLPYIYSEAWRVTKDGGVIMSPLAYNYPEDKMTWGIKDQFFFGDNLMVGIVTEYLKRDMDIYLPKGEWYNLWSDEKVKGGGYINVDAPLNSTPIFVKAGSIMPFGPIIQHVDEQSDAPLDIKIYPGCNGEYTLYLDDKHSYEYEKGRYSEIRFIYNDSTSTLVIETVTNGYRDFESEPLSLRISIAGEGGCYHVNYSGVTGKITLE